MKKLLIAIFMLLALPVFADVMPFYVKSIPHDAIGMYQTGEKITIFSHPEANSKILKEYNLTYDSNSMPDNMFGFLLNEKKLGFLYVTDIGDDNWVEVLFNKQTGEKGWVLAEDRLQFLPWINFYNLYGRKYGLRLFKDTPDSIEVLMSKSDEDSQCVARLNNYVKQIKLTAIRGNWALVSVYDLDKTLKTGFLRWRASDGTIYAFPNIK